MKVNYFYLFFFNLFLFLEWQYVLNIMCFEFIFSCRDDFQGIDRITYGDDDGIEGEKRTQEPIMYHLGVGHYVNFKNQLPPRKDMITSPLLLVIITMMFQVPLLLSNMTSALNDINKLCSIINILWISCRNMGSSQ